MRFSCQAPRSRTHDPAGSRALLFTRACVLLSRTAFAFFFFSWGGRRNPAAVTFSTCARRFVLLNSATRFWAKVARELTGASAHPALFPQLATDDIVLLLVYCLIEVGTSGGGNGAGGGGCASFLADLAFVKAFHFCEDSTSAVYFAISTFEVSSQQLLRAPAPC